MAKLIDHELDDGRSVPAIVTGANDDGTVNLRVLGTSAIEGDTFVNNVKLPKASSSAAASDASSSSESSPAKKTVARKAPAKKAPAKKTTS